MSEDALQALTIALESARLGGAVYPPREQVFAALNATPVNQVRVIILGQDPYHGPDEAHGLSFSVQAGVAVPRSLKNVFKELHADLGYQPAMHGNLSTWANQGVLLLNTILTVEHRKPLSHEEIGWQTVTNAVVDHVSSAALPSVFILWGREAQKLRPRVDETRHLVLESSHPSPLGARRSFFGSRPFSKANAFLAENGRGEVDWALPLFPQPLRHNASGT